MHEAEVPPPTVNLMLGDCLVRMGEIPSESVDAVVTDPPAGISFLGKSWDSDKGGRGRWVEYMATRFAECLRVAKPGARMLCWAIPRTSHWTGTAIEDAGWIIEDKVSHLFGQGMPKAASRLKPACEDWWLARKPGDGVPPLNIDACRIASSKPVQLSAGAIGGYDRAADGRYELGTGRRYGDAGRWPANAVLTCCGEAPHVDGCPVATLDPLGKDGASRFFFCSKVSPKDRGEGNDHPTVKPTDLMSWLVRLITNPGDVVLDPFMGSGSTGKAAIIEGRRFIGIDEDPASFAIAERRIAEAKPSMPLFSFFGEV